MTQQQAWYASMFLNTCTNRPGAYRAHADYIEGEGWGVRVDGTPDRLLYTAQDVAVYAAHLYGLRIPHQSEE